jgi:hypothetical protein
VAEWLKAHAWRACGLQKGLVGSNPTPSALFASRYGFLREPWRAPVWLPCVRSCVRCEPVGGQHTASSQRLALRLQVCQDVALQERRGCLPAPQGLQVFERKLLQLRGAGQRGAAVMRGCRASHASERHWAEQYFFGLPLRRGSKGFPHPSRAQTEPEANVATLGWVPAATEPDQARGFGSKLTPTPVTDGRVGTLDYGSGAPKGGQCVSKASTKAAWFRRSR